MGVTCQILIRRPREGVHKAGETVTGIARYATDVAEEYKDIVLSFVGKGICSWTETRHTTKGIESVTYTGTDVYTAQYISIHDRGPEPTFILPVGRYEYRFRFFLPKDIPPSFENDVCSIKYKLALKFEKPNSFNIQHKTYGSEVNVFGYVKAESAEGNIYFGLYKTLFKPFSKKVSEANLKGELSKTLFNPGQSADLHYEVTNDTDVTIPSVKTELICHTTYTANCGRKKQSDTTIKECTVETPSVPDNAIANMSNTIPILPHLYSIQNCRIMVKKYKLKVTVRFPIPFFNASTEIPIVIGEVYGDYDVERSVQETVKKPPSYLEANKSDKKNCTSGSTKFYT